MLFFVTVPLWLGIIVFIINAMVQSGRRSQIAKAVQLAQIEAERTSKKCPMCAEVVKIEARVCRHCRHEFKEVPVLPSPALTYDPSRNLKPHLLPPRLGH